jgi:hypothetical protein
MTNSNATEAEHNEAIEAIRERGKSDGSDAGSWVIDGNTTRERAREIYQGIEDGDSKILHGLPELQLGQWADDPSFEEILDDLGIEYTDDEVDDLFQEYGDAWSEGMTERVQRDAMLAMPLSIKLTNSDDDDGMVTAWCENAEQAKHDQSIEGSHWEILEYDAAYASFLDRPTLVEDLQREGYDVDDSEYSEPDEIDLAYWAYKSEAEQKGETVMTREVWLALR